MTHDVSSHARSLLNRRNFLGQSATGLGAIALTSLLSKQGLLADQPAEVDCRHPFEMAGEHDQRRGPEFDRLERLDGVVTR